MTDTTNASERLERRLRPVILLLDKHQVVEDLVHRQQSNRQELVESLLHRQQEAELANRIGRLNPAEVAHLLERVTIEHRDVIWTQVPVDRAGEVLRELSDAVAERLVRNTDRARLVTICAATDPDDLVHLADFIPEEILDEATRGLEANERERLHQTMAWGEDTVGHLMSRTVLHVAESSTLKDAMRAIRRLGKLPAHTDKLFVVDARRRVTGVMPLSTILLNRPRTLVQEVMDPEPITFRAEDEAKAAALAFERYDLVSAAVVDANGRLIGRLTVDAVMDYLREEATEDALARDGLRGDEDLMAPVAESARRRWLWLAVNLTTAFIASRIIGVFSGTIEQLVALATLMPIVASIGGNTGNQTIALVVRGLALDRLRSENLRYVALKELGIALINGALWGGVLGAVGFALYGEPTLAVVLAAATLLNLVVAALSGVAIPFVLERVGRDPAMGSSVLLTFVTDSMGFFIFLGLATVMLVG